MHKATQLHAAPRIAALSTLVLALGCAPSTGSPTADPLAGQGRGRPRRDSGIAITDSGPARDAAPSATDAGRDSGPIARDASAPALADAGSTTSGVWRPFSATSPWNTPIPASPAVRADSATLISHLRDSSSEWPGLNVSIHPWSVPLYEVDSRVPLVPVYTALSNLGEDHTFMWPVPSSALPAPESDGHLLLVDRATGQSYDFYQARHRSDGAWDCTLCATSDMTGSGVRPPKGGTAPWYESHGSRACGFPLVAGLVSVEEIRAGRIDHALILAYPGIRASWFVPPASTSQGPNGIISTDRGIPCGGRVQLDPALDLDTLSLSPAARTIARALQVYGAYVGDFAGTINVYADGSPDARASWSSGLLSTGDVSGIPLDRMRVLDWGTMRPD